MPVISATTRKRIEAQGFIGIEDKTLVQINYWLRFSPAICLIWTAFGVVLASPIILWLLVPFALAGGIFRGHPFDAIYSYGFRYIFKSPPLPSYGFPRRFSYLMGAVMLSITALFFQFEQNTIGYIFGIFMILMATINVATGFCVPSFIYNFCIRKKN